ncbi:uncharacterized protein involved in exopolysaccharide biosynthesis [Novosphingobium sp. SG751A]|uniref:GumC family protein n=1 Tax=Novosphingobium sp. SG751A TaxID=2587000 RepID=UPI001553A49D|nr:hypothetical protein [Novosphingobium sp. SG751A]NOW45598.1 uncharacterized protein involved in exopolysaccharide biosynthesis [Novosphingobium sp. SG751A]
MIIYGLIVLYVVLAPPSYYARAIVMIDPRRNVVNTERGGAMNYLMPTADTVATEISSIQSRENAAEVVRRLHLDQNSSFTKVSLKFRVLDGMLGVGSFVRSTVGGVIRAVTGDTTPVRDSDPSTDTPQRYAQDNLLNNLNVEGVGQSYSIEVGFKWGDPVLAAKIVNTLIQVHAEREGDLRRQVRLNGTKELAESLEKHRAKIGELEKRLADARARAGVLNLQGPNLGGDVSMMTAQQASAQADAALVSGRNRAAMADAAVDANPTIQALRTQLSLAQAEALSGTSRYGPLHPLAVEGRQKVETLKAAIDKQSASIRKTAMAGLGVEAAAQSQRAGAQGVALRKSKAEMASSLQATGTVAQLEHERDFELTTYNADFDRYKRIVSTLDSVGDLTVETVASTPQVPNAPKIKLLLILGVVLALLGSLMLAVLAEAGTFFRNLKEA